MVIYGLGSMLTAIWSAVYVLALGWSFGGHGGIQGHSLAPVLDDLSQTVRDQVLVEADLDIDFNGFVPTRTGTLITPTHRYTRRDTGEDARYELTAIS